MRAITVPIQTMKKLYALLFSLLAGLHLQAGETNLVIVPITRSPRPGEILRVSLVAPQGKQIIAIGYLWIPIEEKRDYGSGGGLAKVELFPPRRSEEEKPFQLTHKLELRANSSETVATFHGARGATFSLLWKTN